MRWIIYVYLIIAGLFLNMNLAYAESSNMSNRNLQNKTIAVINTAKKYIEEHGMNDSIIYFKNNSYAIFIGDYQGYYYVSPLHPELLKNNQYNYKDPFGERVVQEEINKAKAGGGWLKARLRESETKGIYQCREIYVSPIDETYYLGSWYQYPTDKNNKCIAQV